MSHQSTNQGPYTLRIANKDDIPQLCQIERSATARFGSIPELAFLVEGDVLAATKVVEWLHTGRIYALHEQQQQQQQQQDRKIIGFVAAHPMDTTLYIAEISVLTDQHGKGAGSILLNAIFDWARELKREGRSTHARVSLTTYADVAWNGPWYRKRGFREVPAESLGPKHVDKMSHDQGERNLVRPGFRRCCMLWEE